MKRNFSDFLSAYFEYSRDGFVPDRFHKWVGLSLIAGALERKVSLKQDLIYYVPNIYVMLVSHPKGGKSTAIERGAELLEELTSDQFNPNFRIISNQTNEPTLIKRMRNVEQIPIGLTGKFLAQSPGYFYASEASSSALQNTHGDFIATMTALYDCPKRFRKDLSSMDEPAIIDHPCMNLLAGATFNYLKTLVNEQSVLGGFASRLIYIVSGERKVRKSRWEEKKNIDARMKFRLIEDLAHINKMMGPMIPSEEWKAKYEEWQPQFDQSLIDLNSEKLESIMARKDTNLIKVSILLSISEGDSFRLEGKHFDQALELIEDAYKDNASIIASAVVADKQSQSGLNQIIGQTLRKAGGTLTMRKLKDGIVKNGNNLEQVVKTIDFMLDAGHLERDSSGNVKLLIDPNTYL